MSESFAKRLWLEEDLSDNHRWSYRLSKVLYSGRSSFQEIDLVETPTFGRVLLLDGKMQSAEADEIVYHELLVHPALLHHPNPRTVFIMGGGEGATARECLRHASVEKVVMADIDKVVCDVCMEHLPRNSAAFSNPRLHLVNRDARAYLESFPAGSFDVIIGDLADPLDGGPCYQLYTHEFYQSVVKDRLGPGGIFITQSGPAGFDSCREVFSCIHKTLTNVFPTVVPYVQHIPSFCDCWGFNMAFRDTASKVLTADEFNEAAATRVSGELAYIDGATWVGLRSLNKAVRKAIADETEIYTAECGRFIHGNGATK